MAIDPDTVHGAETGFRQGVHVDGRERIGPLALYRWRIAPAGEAARRGGGGTPLPLSLRLLVERPSPDHPRHPAATAASSRPLHKGRAVHGDCPGYSARRRNRISVGGGHVDGRERIGPLALYRWGIATRGRRLAGEGAERPFPCLDVSPETVFQGGSRSPPPPGRYRGLLPPPSQGAGSVWRLTRIQCTGSMKGIFGKGVFTLTAERLPPPWHCIDGKSPPAGEAARRGGGGTPLPLSPASLG